MVQVKFRLLLSLLLVLLTAGNAAADGQRVRKLLIYVDLEKDGTATVYEKWDLSTGDKITEWYLVRENLDDITIDNMVVVEDEQAFQDDGEWDVDRTLEQKAGKFGMVHKDNGVELCWGVGSHGDHVFEVLYQMHGAVKSLQDYDLFHLQLVSPGLSTPPEEVTVCIGSELAQLDTTNTRIWGFGYKGTCLFEDGCVLLESDGALDEEDSVIALLRFDKGIFEPVSVRDQNFKEVLDRAMVGADFGEKKKKEEDDISGFGAFVTLLVFLGIGYSMFRRHKKLSKSGRMKYIFNRDIKEKDIAWYRDIPLAGNLPAADLTLRTLGEDDNNLGKLCSALILRMVYNGYLEVSRSVENETSIRFTSKPTQDLDAISAGLYRFLKEAAGENGILEYSEFSTWARKNMETLYDWSNLIKKAAQDFMQTNDWSAEIYTLTEKGKAEALHMLGLRRFLKEFTLTSEREAFDVHLWKEYLVYGTLLGVAAKVAKQLKEIAPEFRNAEDLVYVSNDFALPLYLAVSNMEKRLEYESDSYSSSSSGYGGSSSRGGGGGYSGGGRGGGGR